MFGPLIIQLLYPESMSGFYLMFTFIPGFIVLAIGLMKSHKDKNNKEYLKPKNKILATSINPGIAIIVLLFLIFTVGLIVQFFNL